MYTLSLYQMEFWLVSQDWWKTLGIPKMFNLWNDTCWLSCFLELVMVMMTNSFMWNLKIFSLNFVQYIRLLILMANQSIASTQLVFVKNIYEGSWSLFMWWMSYKLRSVGCFVKNHFGNKSHFSSLVSSIFK